MVKKLQLFRMGTLLLLATSLPYLNGCGKGELTSAFSANLAQDIVAVCQKEYKIDIEAEILDNTLYVYLPLEDIILSARFLSEESMEKINNVTLASSRAGLSAAPDIKFYKIIASDKKNPGIEFVITRYVMDIKKFMLGAISREDYIQRMEMDIEFNPGIMGYNFVKSFFKELETAEASQIIKNYFPDSLSVNKISPTFFAMLMEHSMKENKKYVIMDIKSKRISKFKALVYAKVQENYDIHKDHPEHKFQTPNGFINEYIFAINTRLIPKIIVDEMPEVCSASVGVWVGVGGRHEAKQEAGISHFIEHIVFKGTHTRSCQEIKESIEGIGGSLNVFTSKEYTCFYAKVLGKDVLKALHVLSDMVLNPELKENDIEQEKDVIVEEIKMYMDSPSQQVHDYLDEILWPNHPMGYSLTGPEENVRSFTASDFKDFRARYYTPNQIVISVAGNVDAEAIIQDVERIFAASASLEVMDPESFTFKAGGAPVHWTEKDTEQTHLALGIHSYSRTHPMRYPLSVLNIILGGNMSSRLFQELREDRGLAYDIRSSVYRYEDTGTLEIAAGLEPQNLEETLKLTMKAFKRLQEETVPDDELMRAKAYYKGRVQLSLEKTSTRMSWHGEDLIFGDTVLSQQEILDKIDAVTSAHLQEVAQDIFRSERICMAVISPEKQPLALDECLHVH